MDRMLIGQAAREPSTARSYGDDAARARRIALWFRKRIELADDEFDRFMLETEPKEDRTIITRYLAGELDDVQSTRVEERARNDSGFCDHLFWVATYGSGRPGDRVGLR